MTIIKHQAGYEVLLLYTITKSTSHSLPVKRH